MDDISISEMRRLIEVVWRLRSPEGCPWDRKQTPRSLCPYLIEETYELVEAIEDGTVMKIAEELGDVLLHVLLQIKIADENDQFGGAEVFGMIADKLIRRHPHVFDDEPLDDQREITERWHAIKAEERTGQSLLSSVPRALPALQRAQKLQRRASRVGFDWDSTAPIIDKIHEELAELREAREEGDVEAIAEETGDLLFAVVNLARALGVDAEDALRATNRKFERRFQVIEDAARRQKRALDDLSLEEMDGLWESAKRPDPD